MKEMSKEEFYEKIRSVIRGEISTTKLVKELQTDSRTLNNKIQELSVYNESLYIAFIKKDYLLITLFHLICYFFGKVFVSFFHSFAYFVSYHVN